MQKFIPPHHFKNFSPLILSSLNTLIFSSLLLHLYLSHFLLSLSFSSSPPSLSLTEREAPGAGITSRRGLQRRQWARATAGASVGDGGGPPPPGSADGGPPGASSPWREEDNVDGGGGGLRTTATIGGWGWWRRRLEDNGRMAAGVLIFLCLEFYFISRFFLFACGRWKSDFVCGCAGHMWKSWFLQTFSSMQPAQLLAKIRFVRLQKWFS